ncbi:uncharacterized protein LOC130675565 isoform X2 [Microplitis mediator]|uniref:uncharacterized protein LOC130675565 isoform X2 n=1 Tax=Microplitis mediator TaxID=375433 RepID=UPI002553A80E|nr:uncharacterized protein LOC130675565 isoform X2 [Microplitis mediator]
MSGIPILLVTANVGSIFEEPGLMLKTWTEEFLSTISRLDPKFIALHCQEVGGKNYEQSMRHVENFVRLLMSSEELRLFDKVTVFLDEDFSSAEHFTALGNFYFVHESLKDVFIWDFQAYKFVVVAGKEVHSGNIESVSTKEKAKFPQNFFPECKWSRKGFLRTRWSINGTVFDLINIHLFHDASNFIAMETFPSVYSKTRRKALEHTLDKFHNDQYPNVPYFLFGDFNFRTDTSGVIKKLTEDTQESQLSNKGSLSKLQFRNKDDSLILTLGKKEFTHCEHQNVFTENSARWLQEYDRELEVFEGRLFEFPIEFVPSYPFEEDVSQGSNFMQTRVPAWCDRILLSPTAKTLISSPDTVKYGIIGANTCMGDHKPVYLRIFITSNAGTINCCLSCPHLCFKVPKHYLELLSMLPGYRSNYLNLQHTDHYSSPKLLHALMIEHDPYTPDSMDSPSPSAFPTSAEPDQDYEQINNFVKKKPSNEKTFKMAVSPALLKSKLEFIQNEQKAQREKHHKNVLESRCNSWPKTRESKRQYKMKKHRSSSDISSMCGSNESSEESRIFSLTSSIVRKSISHIVIPKIAIINASNFQSKESSVDLQEERLFSFIKDRSIGKDTTSGEGSSLELDLSDKKQEYQSDSNKIYSCNQDSGVDTLDADDVFSPTKPLIVSSNETTSSYSLDLNKDYHHFEDVINKNSEFEIEIDELEKISGLTTNIQNLISSTEQNITSKNINRSSSINSKNSYNENLNPSKLKSNKITQKNLINVHKCKKCCCVIR